jgi:FkbM family methyltransferase
MGRVCSPSRGYTAIVQESRNTRHLSSAGIKLRAAIREWRKTMTLAQIKDDFRNGRYAKDAYIDRMHDFHQILFQYSSLLPLTDIREIRITDNCVVMTTRKRNIHLLCDPYDKRLVPIEILNFEEYEPAELDVILSLIEKNCSPRCRFMDIGANIGWYSLNVAKEQPDADILAFEPIPKTFDYLRKNVEMNGLMNIECRNLGFSDKNTKMDFFFNKEGSGNASMRDLGGRELTERITCQVVSLDEYAVSAGIHADFIKCDTEGAEFLVFKGGIEFIKDQRPIIFTEMLRKWCRAFGYHPNDIIDFLGGLGYRCHVLESGRLVEFGRVTEQTKATNYFFLDPRKHRF